MAKRKKVARKPPSRPAKSTQTAARPAPARSAPANAASTEQMATLFKCTERQIQLLAEDKIVIKVGHGLYDFAKSTQNYVEHLRAQAAGRAGVDPDTDVASANRERSLEQAAWYRTRRLQVQKDLINVKSVRDLGVRFMRGVRQAVLGLSNAIAHEVPTLNARDVAAIKRLCTDLLEDMANGQGFDLAGLPDENSDVLDDNAGEGDSGDAEAAAAGDPV